MAGFHAGPPSRWNWNLKMLVFKREGNPENPEKKTLGAWREPTINSNPHMGRKVEGRKKKER